MLGLLTAVTDKPKSTIRLWIYTIHIWTLTNDLFRPHGPLARYVKLRVAHAPGMPGTFSPPPRVSDPDMHHDTDVTHVPWWMPGSLTSGFLWIRWWEKRSRHSRHIWYLVSCPCSQGSVGTSFRNPWLWLTYRTCHQIIWLKPCPLGPFGSS